MKSARMDGGAISTKRPKFLLFVASSVEASTKNGKFDQDLGQPADREK
jgi:hypothetical protein